MIARVMAAVAFFLAGTTASFAADETGSCPLPGKSPDPVISSHILPKYPREAVKAREHGHTVVTVTIGADGTPKELAVIGSSGSTRLDDAATSIIKSNWRWKPFPGDCSPLPAQLIVDFGWSVNAPKADFGLVISAAQYPAGAAERYESGDTYLAITLDDAGTVTDAKIAYSSGYADLDEKSLVLVKGKPGIFAGKPTGDRIMLARWKLPTPQYDHVELVAITASRILLP